jgi:hypothetical protein
VDPDRGKPGAAARNMGGGTRIIQEVGAWLDRWLGRIQ